MKITGIEISSDVIILGNGRWEGMFPHTERMLPCCVERCVRFAWRQDESTSVDGSLERRMGYH